MRYSLVFFVIILHSASHAQVILPAYQAVQYKGGSIPTLTTTAVTSITATTASSGGDITVSATSVTARGVCWATSTGPTTASTTTSDGTGTGSFTSSITGLSAGTTYYVRAYATNSSGTGYGTEYSFTTSAITLGATYQGGIVGYILGPGDNGYDASNQHGYIVTASDINTGTKWYNGSNIDLATGTTLGTGLDNTALIISSQGAGSYAASIAAAVTNGGYSDWYLPSKDELDKINANRATSNPGMTAYYWSSSQSGSTTAWMQNFAGTATGSGTQQSKSKSIAIYKVRAIRNF